MAWALRVTRNLAVDVLRRRAREHDLDEVDVAVADTASEVVLRLTVMDALRDLPDKQRHSIVMRYLLDQSQAEVARTLGVQPGTVATHVSRAISQLRITLSDHQTSSSTRPEGPVMHVASADEAAQLVGTNQPVQTRITARGEGQFDADIGIPAVYRPRAQRRTRWTRGDSPDVIVGTEFDCVVIDLDEQRRPIVTDALTPDETAQWAKLLQQVRRLRIGEHRHGTITAVLPFGALVDLDGIRGLLPTPELDPEAPLNVGQPVTVEIVNTDDTFARIGLRLVTRSPNQER